MSRFCPFWWGWLSALLFVAGYSRRLDRMTLLGGPVWIREPEPELLDPHYDWRDETWYRCQNCERATLTGLCGCGDAEPVAIATTKIGTLREEGVET